MIYMCKIYEFPKAMVLPQALKDRLQGSAKEYVKLLTEILEYFDNENFDDEDLLKVMEIILTTYLETIEKAVEEL